MTKPRILDLPSVQASNPKRSKLHNPVLSGSYPVDQGEQTVGSEKPSFCISHRGLRVEYKSEYHAKRYLARVQKNFPGEGVIFIKRFPLPEYMR